MLKRYAPELSREPWDAVLIGSGPGSLTAAVLLAEAGQRVLVHDGLLARFDQWGDEKQLLAEARLPAGRTVHDAPLPTAMAGCRSAAAAATPCR